MIHSLVTGYLGTFAIIATALNGGDEMMGYDCQRCESTPRCHRCNMVPMPVPLLNQPSAAMGENDGVDD